jgi:hypothetical protein
MLSTLSTSYRLYWTWNEKSWDPQKSLEEFYYSIPKKYRLTMPYEYRDDFKTQSPPDYNDQFIFFMLAFFDSSIEKTEEQKLNLWLSALISLLEVNHAPWISTYAINCIKRDLLDILRTKTYDDVQKIFKNHIPDTRKRNSLMTLLRVISVINNGPNGYWF